MPNVALTAPAGHLLRVVRALVSEGWSVSRLPDGGKLKRNGQLMVLKTPRGGLRVRLFVYKVTGSSRASPYERRIEITSNYEKVERLPDYQDVVLGYSPDEDIYVGLTPERLEHGGTTSNASSFLDIEGLKWPKTDEILVEVRAGKLFGFEYQAFVKPPRLGEYFFNLEVIHAGTYRGNGRYAGSTLHRPVPASLGIDAKYVSGDVLELTGPTPASPARRPAASGVSDTLVEAYENKELNEIARRNLTPQQLEAIQRRCADNGQLGERFVLEHERRELRKKGLDQLADRVRWVSKETVSAGYDILSYEADGTERYIEVKSTQGRRRAIEISELEWRTAVREKNRYFIYRVVEVRRAPRLQQVLRNPAEAERAGRITKSPTGWRVTLPADQ